MTIELDISEIQGNIKAGKYVNEASVSQGIVLRLLSRLGWQIFDSAIVWPEYSVEGKRVDYALCHPRSKPLIFVEVKGIGQSDGSERQLFEYAFHHGIPMAVLTDGQEWSFFLPAEQGDYQERCVYKLDIVARPVEESAKIFQRYLAYSEVSSGKAIQNARDDYKNVSKDRQIQNALPEAWKRLLEEEDDLLLELMADKVETICGFKPSLDTVANFLSRKVLSSTISFPTQAPLSVQQKTQPLSHSVKKAEHIDYNDEVSSKDFSGFILNGTKYQERTAKDVMIKVLGVLHSRDDSFLQRFASLPHHGRRRRYISHNKMELYPGRPDLCEEFSEQHFGDWWISTNHSKKTIKEIIEIACRVSGIKFGENLILI